MDQHFQVVVFTSDLAAEVVPTSWFVESSNDCCYFPTNRAAGWRRLQEAAGSSPDLSWPTWKVAIQRSYDYFKLANEKVKKILKKGTVDSSQEDNKKKKKLPIGPPPSVIPPLGKVSLSAPPPHPPIQTARSDPPTKSAVVYAAQPTVNQPASTSAEETDTSAVETSAIQDEDAEAAASLIASTVNQRMTDGIPIDGLIIQTNDIELLRNEVAALKDEIQRFEASITTEIAKACVVVPYRKKELLIPLCN